MGSTAPDSPTLNAIIFSKDRACQLDALLRSIREKVEAWQTRGRWSIIYTYSNESFRTGYERLRGDKGSGGFEFVDEASCDGDFRRAVVDAMESHAARFVAPHCMFLVDDDVFKSDWPNDSCGPMQVLLEDRKVACVSLRMCPRYDYCYAMDCETPPPRFDRRGRWKWRKAKGDWGYPMSVDGHVFRSSDLLPLVRQIDFRNPNTLEAALAKMPLRTRPRMVCYPEAIVVNLPINIVQTEWENRAAENHPAGAEHLNGEYLGGRRLDLEPVYALRTNRGCHHEMPIQWLPPSQRHTL